MNRAVGNGPKPVIRMVGGILFAEQAHNLVDREHRRQAPLGDGCFDLRQLGLDRWIGAQRSQHALFQQRPHPLDLLLPPLADQPFDYDAYLRQRGVPIGGRAGVDARPAEE